MFDSSNSSKNLALKCQPSYFSANFFDMDGLINEYTIRCFVGKKIHNKNLSWSKSVKVYTRLYQNKLESIMRALSDALPSGHRAMANCILAAGGPLRRWGTPTIGHPGGCNIFFLSKLDKKIFFGILDYKSNFEACMILQKPVLSLKGNEF